MNGQFKKQPSDKIVLKPVQAIGKEYQVPYVRFPSHCPCCMKETTGILESEIKRKGSIFSGFNKKSIQIPYCIECIEHVKKEKKFKIALNILQGVAGIGVLGLGKFVGKLSPQVLIPVIMGVLWAIKALKTRGIDKKLHANKDETITFSVEKTRSSRVASCPEILGADYANVNVEIRNKKYSNLFKEMNRDIISS